MADATHRADSTQKTPNAPLPAHDGTANSAPDPLTAWGESLARFEQAKAEHDDYERTVWIPAAEADDEREAAAGNPWPGVEPADPENAGAIERYHSAKAATPHQPAHLTDAINEQMEALQQAYLAAVDFLIEQVPAPNVAAVLLKLELALKRSEDFVGMFDGHQEAIFADLRRLADNEARSAYLDVAWAWLDRWEALGGDVSVSYGRDLKPVGVHRGMLVDLDLWQRTDTGREDLPPYAWRRRRRGAFTGSRHIPAVEYRDMSSLIIIHQSGAVHLITDGASYTRDGTLIGVSSKIIELPRARSAFYVRGSSWAINSIKEVGDDATSFDEFTDTLPKILDGVLCGFDRVFLDLAPPVARHFELTCIGWSDRLSRAVAAIATTYEPNDPADIHGLSRLEGYQQFQPVLAPLAGLCPVVDSPAVLGRAINSAEDLDAMDIERDGLALIEEQRRVPFNFEGRAAYLIGGLAELTTATQTGVVRKVLKYWPDRIGEPIRPEGAEPIADVAERYADRLAA